METNTTKQNESLLTEVYKNVMVEIEFMQKYVHDPEIFNPHTTKFKSFLIQSFCYLHPDFHYLSFLNNKDIDLEIIKVAGILQILPGNLIKKCSKLFDNMTEEDIHKFWLKLFSIFKKQKNYSTDLSFVLNWECKITFFSGIESALNYLNYECPVVNINRLNNVNVANEVESWKEQKSSTVVTEDESACFNFDKEQTIDFYSEKLLMNLKQVTSMYRNTTLNRQENKSNYLDFFISFVNLSKNILQYKSNLSNYNFWFLNELDYKMFFNDENLLQDLYFIKRYSNFVKMLKSKITLQ